MWLLLIQLVTQSEFCSLSAWSQLFFLMIPDVEVLKINLLIRVANPVTIQNNPHSGIRAADFVGRTQGKLRDYYRIGKVLGTGKSFNSSSYNRISRLEFLNQARSERCACACTESQALSVQSRFFARAIWTMTRSACFSTRSTFLKKS